MSPNQSPKRSVTDRVWSFLCLLAIMSGLVVFTPIWSVMPEFLRAAAVVPGLLATLLLGVARFASWADSSTSRDASTRR